MSRETKKYISIGNLSLFFIGLNLMLAILYRVPFLNLPLMGDENYYAYPLSLAELGQWYLFSFGHPPGWHLINFVGYSLLGYSVTVAHALALAVNSFLCGLIVYRLKALVGWHCSLLFISLVFTQDYFTRSLSLNHPVILTTMLGLLGLIEFENGKSKRASMLLLASVLIRESSVLYALALTVVRPGFQSTKASAPGLLTFMFIGLWNAMIGEPLYGGGFANQLLATNTQSIHQVIENIGTFYHELLWPTSKLVFVFFAGSIAISWYSKMSFKQVPNLFWRTFFVFVVHSLFFAIYGQDEKRNTFESATALALSSAMLLWVLCQSRKDILKFVPLASITLLFSHHYFNMGSNSHLLEQRAKADVYLKTINAVRKIKSEYGENIDVVSTNPLNFYANRPHMGYVEESLDVRWYGGIPGKSIVGDPDFVLVPAYGIENFAVDDLRTKVKNNFEMIEKIASEGTRTVVEIYKRR